jgi:hypothetical protein
MTWKPYGLTKELYSFWQITYAIKYGIIFKDLEELDEYLEKKKRITSFSKTKSI